MSTPGTRPMIFSGESVRSMLDGRKTQTRRVCKLPRNYAQIDFVGGRGDWDDPSAWGFEDPDHGWFALKADGDYIKEIPCPYGQPGDLIWVKEGFATLPTSAYRSSTGIEQRTNPDDCDVAAVFREGFDRAGKQRWRSPLFMYRWASRLTLRITDVRVERVQDISENDAAAEGMARSHCGGAWGEEGLIEDYADLWDSLNAKRGYPWDDNPWVWALTFDAIKANVDAVLNQEAA